VQGSDLTATAKQVQLPLWQDPLSLRERALETTLDALRARWGHNSIRRGLMLCNQEMTDINPVDDHSTQPLAQMHGRG
jgi:hypothetical protein